MTAGGTLQFTAAVTDKEDVAIEGAKVTWSVSGGTNESTSIDEEGVLTVAAGEEADTPLTVTATYMDGSKAITDSVTVTVTSAVGG